MEPLDAAQRRRIRRQLLAWGRANYRSFPWRDESSGWLTLVAEVLLQRTQARQASATYAEFARAFPTAAAAAVASLEQIARVLSPLGLHSRAAVVKAIASEAVLDGGSPPEDAARLRAIRGVGDYTTSAWLSLHRGRRAAIVDANVYRWLGRLCGRPFGRDPRRVLWVRSLAESLTPRRAYKAFNYALLDFTMNVCTPAKPHCDACPLRRDCAYAADAGNTLVLIPRTRRGARAAPRDRHSVVRSQGARARGGS